MEVIRFSDDVKPCVVTSLEEIDLEGGRSSFWLDFEVHETGWGSLLREKLGIDVHEAHIRDSLNREHPPFFDRTDHYLMVILHGLVPDATSLRLATRPTTLFLLDRVVITVRPEDSVSIPELRDRLISGWKKAPGDGTRLAIRIGLAIIDRFLALKAEQVEQIDRWQEDLLDPSNPFSDWTVLVRQRSSLRRVETILEEQYEAVSLWRGESDVDVDSSLGIRFNDLLEHVNRTLSYTRQLKSELDALVQVNFSAVSHRTNEIVRVLTVVTAIFLPLSLVAGVFGMNFVNMPELRWRYGYFAALGGMVGLAAILFSIFRWRKWV